MAYLYCAAGFYTELRTQHRVFDAELRMADVRRQRDRDMHDERLQQVQRGAHAEAKRIRAEAIQQCSDKFLLYGYAAKYQAYQQRTLAENAPQHADKK